jgi:hypothetical protein
MHLLGDPRQNLKTGSSKTPGSQLARPLHIGGVAGEAELATVHRRTIRTQDMIPRRRELRVVTPNPGVEITIQAVRVVF